ncbi:MAG: caspase family protein [Bacteroidia bacterium]|nr:caspase family protein [Bacteroidia bacterium]
MKKLIALKSLSLLICLMFFQINSLLAQQSYLAYDASSKTELFSDGFDNNSHEWITDNLWVSGKIESGYYNITCKNYLYSTGISPLKAVYMPDGSDFEIETVIKIVKGTGALIFGMTDKYDHYRVELSDNNALEILKDSPSKKKKVEKVFTGIGNFLITRDYNKLTVRCVNGVYFIFANESLVGQFVSIKPEGNQIGFNVGTESEISVDYLKITELKKTEAPILAQNVQAPQNNPAPETVKPQPPVITWFSPAKAATTLKSTNSTVIKAKINSAGGLESVKLYLNGVLYDVPDVTQSVSEAGVYILEKTMNFDLGENNIHLEAANQGGSSTSEKRYFTVPAPVPTTTVAANQAAPQTDGDRGNAVPASSVAPVITWTSPSGLNTTLESFNATVKATVKSGSGLKSVLLYLNGISKGEAEITQKPGETGTFQIEKNLNFGPGENNVYFVATNAEGATKSDPRYFSNPFAVAPVITWSNPESSNIKVNTENLTIEASIKSPTDLKSIKLIVNGETQTEDNIFQPSGSDNSVYTWQSSALLKKGDNSIYISATNIAGTKRSEQRVIKYEAAMTEKRLALVFGNSQYKLGSPLKNPVNDANLMEGTLKQLGFDVIKRLNATKAEMEAAIREFTEKLPNYNVALFYYAGHGNQVDGKNYLIPTDAFLEKPTDCKFEAISVNFVVDEFERYPDNANIVILDACRNNPYANWARGTGDAGFRQVTNTSGTIIAFATSEGATAADGKGDNGLFTEELVKQMVVPQSLHNVFLNTRVQVKKLSNNAQIPIEWDQLNSDFYLLK